MTTILPVEGDETLSESDRRMLGALDRLTDAVSRLCDRMELGTDGLSGVAELVPGEFVKVAGEWVQYVGYEAGRMVLLRKGCAAFSYYEPSDGERFPVEQPF